MEGGQVPVRLKQELGSIRKKQNKAPQKTFRCHQREDRVYFFMVSAKECSFKFKPSLPSFCHCTNSVKTVRAPGAHRATRGVQ